MCPTYNTAYYCYNWTFSQDQQISFKTKPFYLATSVAQRTPKLFFVISNSSTSPLKAVTDWLEKSSPFQGFNGDTEITTPAQSTWRHHRCFSLPCVLFNKSRTQKQKKPQQNSIKSVMVKRSSSLLFGKQSMVNGRHTIFTWKYFSKFKILEKLFNIINQININEYNDKVWLPIN